jgi:hypothetical protein
MKISPGWLFLKIINALQKSEKTSLFQRFSLKMSFSVCFWWLFMCNSCFYWANLQGRRDSTPPPPPKACAVSRGWGSSGSFQQQAVALVMAMKQWGLGLIFISEDNLKKQKVWDASLATKKRGKFLLFTVRLSTCLPGFGNTDYVVCIYVGEGKKTIPYLPPTPADTSWDWRLDYV